MIRWLRNALAPDRVYVVVDPLGPSRAHTTLQGAAEAMAEKGGTEDYVVPLPLVID